MDGASLSIDSASLTPEPFTPPKPQTNCFVCHLDRTSLDNTGSGPSYVAQEFVCLTSEPSALEGAYTALQAHRRRILLNRRRILVKRVCVLERVCEWVGVYARESVRAV